MSLLASKIAVPMLIRALSNSDSEVRASAARKLGLSGGARASVPALMVLLNHDEEADVRLNAALALSCIGDRAAVPAFMKALKDTDKNFRLEAAETLWKLDARAATPAYVKFLTDEEESQAQARALLGRAL